MTRTVRRESETHPLAWPLRPPVPRLRPSGLPVTLPSTGAQPHVRLGHGLAPIRASGDLMGPNMGFRRYQGLALAALTALVVGPLWLCADAASAEPAPGRFSQVSAGNGHTCALRGDGSIVCWGEATWGATETPPGLITQITSSQYHSCALRTDAEVVCWGRRQPEREEYDDQDGSGDQMFAEYGQADAPPGSFSQVSAGGSHSCALDLDGEITY